MGIKTQMQQVLGYPISAYKFSVSQQVPSMLIVFTDAETEGAGVHAPHGHGTAESHLNWAQEQVSNLALNPCNFSLFC